MPISWAASTGAWTCGSSTDAHSGSTLPSAQAGRFPGLRLSAREARLRRMARPLEREPDRRSDEPPGVLDALFLGGIAGRNPDEGALRLDGANAGPAYGRALRFFLRDAASVYVFGARPSVRYFGHRRRHRQAQVHHRRVRGLSAARTARPDVDRSRREAARLSAVETGASARVRRRNAGSRSFRLAGEGRSAGAGDLRRGAPLALRRPDLDGPNQTARLAYESLFPP